MKVREIMTANVIRLEPGESASVAARMLERYNIGALPVCTADGRLCGMITDRDLAVRCMAAEKPGTAKVTDVMTAQVVAVSPDADVRDAGKLMGEKQIRRLPVVEQGRLCGILSLSDLAGNHAAQEALELLSSPLSRRG